MSVIMAFLIGMIIYLIIPTLLIVLIIRAIRKKKIKKLVITTVICAGCIIPFTIIGVLTDPATWCDHEYEIVQNIKPTCSEKGEIHKHCPLCENDTIEYVDATPHQWVTDSVVDASCTEKGTVTKKCSLCGIDNVEHTDAMGHSWGETTTVSATCDRTGFTKRTCSACSLEDTTYIDKTDHSWEKDSVVAATCASEGYTLEKCRVCSATQRTKQSDVLDHSMKEFSRTESTRDTEGKIVFRCEWCSREEIQTIEKLPPLTYIEGVDYEEIYKEYKANKLRADDLYKNNRYRITAQINGMSTGGLLNLTGGATLTMVIKVDNTYVFFIAEFEKDQEEALKTVSVGDTITFEGECLGAGTWSDCEIVTD